MTKATGQSVLTLERILKLAEEIVAGKSISYVGAAKQLAEWLLTQRDALGAMEGNRARDAALSEAVAAAHMQGNAWLSKEAAPAGAVPLKHETYDPSLTTFARPTGFPKIVCLCGSTRFGDAFAKANLDETLAGNIVLSVGCYTHSDAALGIDEKTKAALDELHKRKIDLCDEVLVLNVERCVRCGEHSGAAGTNLLCAADGCDFEPYIGDSTLSEIEYAKKLGKPIRWLNPPQEEP